MTSPPPAARARAPARQERHRTAIRQTPLTDRGWRRRRVQLRLEIEDQVAGILKALGGVLFQAVPQRGVATREDRTPQIGSSGGSSRRIAVIVSGAVPRRNGETPDTIS